MPYRPNLWSRPNDIPAWLNRLGLSCYEYTNAYQRNPGLLAAELRKEWTDDRWALGATAVAAEPLAWNGDFALLAKMIDNAC